MISMTGYGKATAELPDKENKRRNQVAQQQGNGFIHSHRPGLS